MLETVVLLARRRTLQVIETEPAVPVAAIVHATTRQQKMTRG